MTIHIDFLTTRAEIYQYSKIDKAVKFLPDWYKKLPQKNYNPEHNGGVAITMKGCIGLRDLFTKGLILPLWADLNISLGRADTNFLSWQFPDSQTLATINDEKEYGSFINSRQQQHIKLVTPWCGFSKSNVGFCFVQPMWNIPQYSDTIHVLPGVIDFKSQSGINVNLLLSRKPEDRILELKHGMPLVHLMPLTTEKVKIKHHFVDEKELNKKIIQHGHSSVMLGFSGWSTKLRRLQREKNK